VHSLLAAFSYAEALTRKKLAKRKQNKTGA